jgi:AAA ATPase domain
MQLSTAQRLEFLIEGFAAQLEAGVTGDVEPAVRSCDVDLRRAAERGEARRYGRALVEPVAGGDPQPRVARSGEVPARQAHAFRLLEVNPTASGLKRHFDVLLVGRDRELDLLRAAWDRAVQESGCHLFTLLGAAGIGKSRLVSELFASLGDTASVLSGRCLHDGEGITFWPLVEALTPVGEPSRMVLEHLRTGGVATAEELFWEVRQLLESLALDSWRRHTGGGRHRERAQHRRPPQTPYPAASPQQRRTPGQHASPTTTSPRSRRCCDGPAPGSRSELCCSSPSPGAQIARSVRFVQMQRPPVWRKIIAYPLTTPRSRVFFPAAPPAASARFVGWRERCKLRIAEATLS